MIAITIDHTGQIDKMEIPVNANSMATLDLRQGHFFTTVADASSNFFWFSFFFYDGEDLRVSNVEYFDVHGKNFYITDVGVFANLLNLTSEEHRSLLAELEQILQKVFDYLAQFLVLVKQRCNCTSCVAQRNSQTGGVTSLDNLY